MGPGFISGYRRPFCRMMSDRRGKTGGLAGMVVGLAALIALPAAAADAPSSGGPKWAGDSTIERRLPVEGLPDLIVPPMNPVLGRRLFAERACVVCHSVGDTGGFGGGVLGIPAGAGAPDRIDLLDFVARMWRGGMPMLQAQRDLFGEEVDLTGAELGHIIAFLHDPAEQARFSESDIPVFIREFMARRAR